MYLKRIKLLSLGMMCVMGTQSIYADINPNAQFQTSTPTTEHVRWFREPISIVLPVGKERLISFPGKVLFEGNKAPKLTHALVSVLNDNDTIYITAKKSFKKILVPIMLQSTGETILLEISAVPNADDTPVSVLVTSPSLNNSSKNTPQDQGSSHNSSLPYAALFTYVTQTLYPVNDALPQNPYIIRTPMYTTQSVPLVSGNEVFALPLASWRNGSQYITAVELVNHSQFKVTLNPENFRGSWLAADFYRPNNNLSGQPYWVLLPRGSQFSRTTGILISNSPFNSALYKNPGYPLTGGDA